MYEFVYYFVQINLYVNPLLYDFVYVISSVVYHPNTSCLASVYAVGIFCTVGFGRNSFLKFLGTFVLKKSPGNSFSLKRGLSAPKGVQSPLLGGKWGLLPNS